MRGLYSLLRCPLAAASCGRKSCHLTPTPASSTGITNHYHREYQIGLHRSLSSTSSITGSNTKKQTRSSSHSIILGRHVSEALANGCPVVALESTVITHGLPEPRNLELALQLEREIAHGCWSSSPARARGQVVPATVGIVRGQLIVGLSGDQIEYLARSALSKPIKASRRDIPLAQACQLSAGTTVSATMALATSAAANTRARIAVFATGGMGGVHLGGERSMDVSADLHEMARSPMGLVSSGFKSFLDTRRSLELLETLGCTVASLRAIDETYIARAHVRDASCASSSGPKTQHLFPGFFTTVCKERVKSPWQCDSVNEAARILYHCLGPASAHDTNSTNGLARLQNPRAMLLACPIPRKFSLDDDDNDDDANSQGYSPELLEKISAQIDGLEDLSGNEKTPLILAELNRVTGGRSLAANLELLKNNARIGAHLAYEYALLCSGNQQQAADRIEKSSTTTSAVGQTCAAAEGARTGAEDANETHNKQQSESPESRGPPIVIGCTMIDMHVRTKIDDKFKGAIQARSVVFGE